MGLTRYVKDTRGELKHVAWPTQKQTVIYTALVIAISLLTAAYIGVFDFVFTKTLEYGIDAEATQGELFTPTINVSGADGQDIQVTNVTDLDEGDVQFDVTPAAGE